MVKAALLPRKYRLEVNKADAVDGQETLKLLHQNERKSTGFVSFPKQPVHNMSSVATLLSSYVCDLHVCACTRVYLK